MPMKPRSPNEPHRAATPLELFFDLVFVVAVAQAANALHHGLAEGHVTDTLIAFALIFFGIWWAWMLFTWFATSYDTDDIPYRLVVFVQMTGALIVASGVEPVFAHQDLTVVVLGYVVMRIASIFNWLRAAYADPERRPAAMRYAVGIFLVQIAWVGLLFMPQTLRIPGFIVLAIIELLIPVWAERPARTPYHEHHILERYGLFTILVLGESILSTSLAIQSAIDEGALNGSLVSIIIGALLIVYAMWWLYFYQPIRRIADSLTTAFLWAYGHIFIFGATAAVGAGIAVVIDQVTHHAEISAVGAGMVLAIPSAIYVLSLWILQAHSQKENRFDALIHPITAILVLLTPFTGQVILFTGILLSILVVIRVIRHLDGSSDEPHLAG
jgi:low temperature requirement protein LtrA